MNNTAIIETEKLLRGITEEVRTYRGWKKDGRQVAKGEKAVFGTRIYKLIKEVDEETGEEEEHFILVNAKFFAESQLKDSKEKALKEECEEILAELDGGSSFKSINRRIKDLEDKEKKSR